MTEINISMAYRDEPEFQVFLTKLDELATRMKEDDISLPDATYELRTLLQPWTDEDEI